MLLKRSNYAIFTQQNPQLRSVLADNRRNTFDQLWLYFVVGSVPNTLTSNLLFFSCFFKFYYQMLNAFSAFAQLCLLCSWKNPTILLLRNQNPQLCYVGSFNKHANSSVNQRTSATHAQRSLFCTGTIEANLQLCYFTRPRKTYRVPCTWYAIMGAFFWAGWRRKVIRSVRPKSSVLDSMPGREKSRCVWPSKCWSATSRRNIVYTRVLPVSRHRPVLHPIGGSTYAISNVYREEGQLSNKHTEYEPTRLVMSYYERTTDCSRKVPFPIVPSLSLIILSFYFLYVSHRRTHSWKTVTKIHWSPVLSEALQPVARSRRCCT